MVAEPALPPGRTAGAEPAGSAQPALSDDLIDALTRGFRRLRHGMVKPPLATIPIPALGSKVDVAKVFACEAVAELTGTGEPVSVKDVAAVMQLEHSTVSRLLGEAEADGLVVRGEDPADRRRTNVSLTPLGRQVVADSAAMRRFLTRSVLAGWELADVETLARLMTRLADTIGGRLESLARDAMHDYRLQLDSGADASASPGAPVARTIRMEA